MAPPIVDQFQAVVATPSAADWDAFVSQHPAGHLLQFSPWATLKSQSGWRSQRVAVLGYPCDTTDLHPQILAGAQVLLHHRFGVSAAYVPRGPLLSGDSAVDDLLLKALHRLAQRHRAVFLRLEPNRLEDDEHAATLHSWLLLRGFQPVETIQPRSTIHLDLTPPVEQIFASFSKGHRADIRRAERLGVNVRIGTEADIGAFYAIMQATSARAAFGIHAEAYYRSAWCLFQPGSLLLLAEHEGQVCAGHLVFADGRAGLYLYSGATEAGLKTGANHLLEWHAIRWARAQGCTTYDLWGIPDALGRAAAAASADERAALEAMAQQDALNGVYRFKKGFGGKVVRYLPAYDRVYLPPLYALWRRRFS